MSKPIASDEPEKNSWISRIEKAQSAKQMDQWRRACDLIRDKYRYENSKTASGRRYQLLWSNIETLRGATYAKPPKAVVERRYRDKDQTAMTAGMIVERGVNFTLDMNDFNSVFENVRDDYLVYGRGVARIYYEPTMEPDDDDGLDTVDVQGLDAAKQEEAEDDQEDGEPKEKLDFESVKIKFVNREDFAHDGARTWEEVKWVAFRSYLDRDELVDRFPEKGKTIPLDAANAKNSVSKDMIGEGDPKATIWEVWDKSANKVLWVCPSETEPLDEGKPYLKLNGFYPCPKPAYGTLTNDSLAPRPDYIYYQDQVEEIDVLTQRIGSLQQQIKSIIFYKAGPSGEGFPEIERAMVSGVENKAIAIKSWDNFKEGSGGGAPIIPMPIDHIITALEACVKLRQQLIDDVNQICGIADIMRGEGNANETATAQGIKANFGTIRIRTRQAQLARFCRDTIRLVGEVICNHFHAETLMAMSNMPLPTDQDILKQMQEQAIQAQQQQMMQQQQAMQQQSQMGHNGGPPMQGQPQGAMQ